MQNSLIIDINNYISYLCSKGMYVSVHGKLIGGLLEHNAHINPYCLFIKTSDDAWKKCIKCQKKVFNACNGDFLFGICHAGVEEYVFFVDSNTFVSVSGYGISDEEGKKRINRLSKEYGFDKKTLITVYEKSLKHKKENIEELRAVIKPLCHMLSLLELTVSNLPQGESKNKLYDSILSYISRNYMNNILIKHISTACACSPSTVSHIFKEYSGKSVNRYLNELRLKQAEKLLTTSDLSVSSIANLCGYSNSEYFSTAFKKYAGKSPKEYRNR